LNDFRTLELARDGKTQRFKGIQDKGHRREIELTVEAMRAGKPTPIPFDQLAEVSEATLLVHRALARGEVLQLGEAVATPSANDPIPELADTQPVASGNDLTPA